ncbi:MAG: hypothetical protein WCO12_01045 [bacterium]
MKKENPKGEISVEKLSHFRCCLCGKWWSIGDALKRKEWHCPRCGEKQEFSTESKPKFKYETRK